VSSPHAWRELATRPTVLLVLGGLALYPFVRERPAPRVLRLTDAQIERALRAERARSDAPETLESQRATLTRSLEEQALAEHAIAAELYRADDELRHRLAEAARALLASGTRSPPTDDELHALLAEVPVEDRVDAELAAPGGGSQRLFAGVSLAELEAELGLAHLPMPTRDGPVTAPMPLEAGVGTLTLRVHEESESQRIARVRPELERRFHERSAAASERAALEAIVEGYERVERP